MQYLIERFGDIDVFWKTHLHGGGLKFGRQFLSVVKELFGPVERVHEICAGPGFIGFSLLAEGLCNSLSLSDVNPDAIGCQRKTIEKNGLEDRVSSYLSDGLDGIPASEQWDLVVANPPHFGTPAGEGIISDDLDWEFHRRFFGAVGTHLKPHGSVLIQENYVASEESTFLPFIERGDLTLVGTFMNIISIPNTVNPYFYLWLRKRYLELIPGQDSVEEVEVAINLSEQRGFLANLLEYQKYQFVFTNKTLETCKISFLDESGQDSFRLRPLSIVEPGTTAKSGIIYLTSGVFDVVELSKGRLIGRLRVNHRT